MMDWVEISPEQWEFFARDFLAEHGFVIDVEPGRGADAGRDLLVSEQLRGIAKSRPFRWLVSCKHFATSGDAVGLRHEPDIADRVAQHGANGFIGFYSTMASSSLVERLRALAENSTVQDYILYDGNKISQSFYSSGFSNLALRYVPKGYESLRPIQSWLGEYHPLTCEICDKDLLKESITKPFSGILVWGERWDLDDAPIEFAGAVCKGDCDRDLRARLNDRKIMTKWEDVGDLVNPAIFMKHMMGQMNTARSNKEKYTDEAFEKTKEMLISISQRVLREITGEDKERLSTSIMLEGL